MKPRKALWVSFSSDGGQMGATTKYTLTLVIEGDSREAVDDALSREAAKGIIARLHNPPSVVGKLLTPQVIAEMSKEPQLTVARDIKKEAQVKVTKHSQKAEDKKEAVQQPAPKTEAAPQAAEPAKEQDPPSEAEVVQMITKLASVKSTAVVKECFEKMEIKKLSDLKTEHRRQMIDLCQSALA